MKTPEPAVQRVRVARIRYYAESYAVLCRALGERHPTTVACLLALATARSMS